MSERVPDREKVITIVSGMPRSGTSMLMQMLEAAGLEIHSDGERAADLDNPKGYFELEATKRISRDTSFLERSRGKVVKIVAPLLTLLPPDYTYRVIFIERDIDEVMDSQSVMIEHGNRGTGREAEDRALARALEKRIKEAKDWLADSGNVEFCIVTHAGLLDAPMEACSRIVDFLERTGSIVAESWSQADRQALRLRMAEVVDTKLYRQRRRSK